MIDLIPNRTMLVLIPRLAAILFILLQVVGMQVYPGGTMYDVSTIGYSFSKNFFSFKDFTRSIESRKVMVDFSDAMDMKSIISMYSL